MCTEKDKSRLIQVLKILFNKYVITIIIYSFIMSVFSIFGKFDSSFLNKLILIPIIGQIIHFYLEFSIMEI